MGCTKSHIHDNMHTKYSSSVIFYSRKGWPFLMSAYGKGLCLLSLLLGLSLWAILDTGAYSTKLLPPFRLFFFFFFKKSDFKCLEFRAGCRSALCSQTGPHRARPNATPCRAWSHERGPDWGPQRAAQPTYAAWHHSMKIKDIAGHEGQGGNTAAHFWRK